jgi:DNA-binding phage protein
MPKPKTLTKQSKSGTKSLRVHVPFKSEELQDPQKVVETLLECIRVYDLSSFREVLAAHLKTVNKLKLTKKAGIGRRTLYDLIDLDREFNPELSTISALISSLGA